MPLPKQNIALVDLTQKVSSTDLKAVADALQIQVSRDFASIWGQDATLQVVDNSAAVPKGTWPIWIVDEIDVEGVKGYHWTDERGQPFAKVEYREGWSLTASHELLEMLVNPYVNRTMRVKGLDSSGQEVDFLVEVSDPVEDDDYGYRINGVLVSNFYYPAFFDLIKVENRKYDHLGWLTEPRKLLNGGYISWKDAAGQWYQAFMIEGQLIIKKLGDTMPLTAREKRTLWTLGAIGLGITTVLIFIISKISNNGNRLR